MSRRWRPGARRLNDRPPYVVSGGPQRRLKMIRRAMIATAASRITTAGTVGFGSGSVEAVVALDRRSALVPWTAGPACFAAIVVAAVIPAPVAADAWLPFAPVVVKRDVNDR